MPRARSSASGSVGTRAWIVLMVGHDNNDPLFLQAKEAQRFGARAIPRQERVRDYHGQRVVEGQRLMQAASDIMRGWEHVTGVDGVERDFYVRQLWDQKGSAIVELMNPATLTLYAKLCGQTLARAQRPIPATRSPSQATWVAATRSTARSRTSPRPTRTRTSRTTSGSRRPSRWRDRGDPGPVAVRDRVQGAPSGMAGEDDLRADPNHDPARGRFRTIRMMRRRCVILESAGR